MELMYDVEKESEKKAPANLWKGKCMQKTSAFKLNGLHVCIIKYAAV